MAIGGMYLDRLPYNFDESDFRRTCVGTDSPSAARSGTPPAPMTCLFGPDGKEYRIDVLIDFSDEAESSEWRNNQETTREVVLEPTGDGRHHLRIAPTRSSVTS